MKSVLLIGSEGMLGRELYIRLKEKYNVKTTTKEIMNICNKEEVRKKIKELKPYFIINCAAYTNVDMCEKEYEIANKVNGIAVENIALSAKETDCIFIQISTDYVFDGTLELDKSYTEDMKPNPINSYGKTKLLGEDNAKKAGKYYILRTSWLYGIFGKNFVKTMLKLSNEKDSIAVVNDQYGSPTSVTTLCNIIKQIMEKEPEYGIYNCTNEGITTWYEFAVKIMELSGKKIKIEPISSKRYLECYPQTALRPTNSKLSKSKLRSTGIYPESYEEALKKYLEREVEK